MECVRNMKFVYTTTTLLCLLIPLLRPYVSGLRHTSTRVLFRHRARYPTRSRNSSAHTFHNTQQQSQSYRICTRTTRTTAIPQGIAVAVVQTDWGHSTCAWFARVLFYCFRLYLFVAIYVYTGADNVTMQCDTAAICDYAHHDFRGARRLEGLKIGSVISYRSVSNMQHDTYKAHAWR